MVYVTSPKPPPFGNCLSNVRREGGDACHNTSYSSSAAANQSLTLWPVTRGMHIETSSITNSNTFHARGKSDQRVASPTGRRQGPRPCTLHLAHALKRVDFLSWLPTAVVIRSLSRALAAEACCHAARLRVNSLSGHAVLRWPSQRQARLSPLLQRPYPSSAACNRSVGGPLRLSAMSDKGQRDISSFFGKPAGVKSAAPKPAAKPPDPNGNGSGVPVTSTNGSRSAATESSPAKPKASPRHLHLHICQQSLLNEHQHSVLCVCESQIPISSEDLGTDPQAAGTQPATGLKRLKKAGDEPAQLASGTAAKRKHTQAAVATELEDDISDGSPAKVGTSVCKQVSR